MKKQIKKGFTLVELLVVIAILAILGTVSIVGYTSFTTKAKQSNSEQELIQIKSFLLADWLDGYVGDTQSGLQILKENGKYNVTMKDATYDPVDTTQAVDSNAQYYTKNDDVYTKTAKPLSAFAAETNYYTLNKSSAANTEEMLKEVLDEDASEFKDLIKFIGSETDGVFAIESVIYEAKNKYDALWTISDDSIKSDKNGNITYSNYLNKPAA